MPASTAPLGDKQVDDLAGRVAHVQVSVDRVGEEPDHLAVQQGEQDAVAGCSR